VLERPKRLGGVWTNVFIEASKLCETTPQGYQML